mmetsp:Transcript_35870/g.107823  ORF Transcript_35870/g.107823 Transcript_35870/m.107823 type:complete len:269 (+) Transcript_35870:2390-3196(+)
MCSSKATQPRSVSVASIISFSSRSICASRLADRRTSASPPSGATACRVDCIEFGRDNGGLVTLKLARRVGRRGCLPPRPPSTAGMVVVVIPSTSPPAAGTGGASPPLPPLPPPLAAAAAAAAGTLALDLTDPGRVGLAGLGPLSEPLRVGLGGRMAGFGGGGPRSVEPVRFRGGGRVAGFGGGAFLAGAAFPTIEGGRGLLGPSGLGRNLTTAGGGLAAAVAAAAEATAAWVIGGGVIDGLAATAGGFVAAFLGMGGVVSGGRAGRSS